MSPPASSEDNPNLTGAGLLVGMVVGLVVGLVVGMVVGMVVGLVVGPAAIQAPATANTITNASTQPVVFLIRLNGRSSLIEDEDAHSMPKRYIAVHRPKRPVFNPSRPHLPPA
jgi:hypothetical protein